MDIEQEKEQLGFFLGLLGSKKFRIEYRPELPEGLRWWGILEDKEACCPVAGRYGIRPTAYGWSGKDVFMKIRACLPPQPTTTNADLDRLGICSMDHTPKGHPIRKRADNPQTSQSVGISLV